MAYTTRLSSQVSDFLYFGITNFVSVVYNFCCSQVGAKFAVLVFAFLHWENSWEEFVEISFDCGFRIGSYSLVVAQV